MRSASRQFVDVDGVVADVTIPTYIGGPCSLSEAWRTSVDGEGLSVVMVQITIIYYYCAQTLDHFRSSDNLFSNGIPLPVEGFHF